jgi:hypothetical protein
VSIADSLGIIRQHAELPVVCGSCCAQTVLREHDEAIDYALIDAATLRELQIELSLLNRALALFARFPESRIALKVNKEQLHPKQFPRTDRDPEFEAALAADPELSLFLRRSSFHLPSRHRWVTAAIATLDERDFSDIHCPACGVGVLRLADGFLTSRSRS